MVERFTVRPGLASPFKDIIDEQSQRKSAERKKVRNALYASDVFQCQRKVFMQFFPEVFPGELIDGRTARIFQNGEDVHVRLGNCFHADDRVDFYDEVQVPRGELDVHGRCDGVAELQGQVYIIEFKSINKPTVDAPKEEHVGQLTYYLHVFEGRRAELRKDFGVLDGEIVDATRVGDLASGSGRDFATLEPVDKLLLLSPGVIRGELVYECKPTQELFHFPVEYDAKMAEKVVLWFKQLREYLQSGEMPRAMHDGAKFPCKWRNGACAYYEFCHGAKKDVVQTAGLLKFPL